DRGPPAGEFGSRRAAVEFLEGRELPLGGGERLGRSHQRSVGNQATGSRIDLLRVPVPRLPQLASDREILRPFDGTDARQTPPALTPRAGPGFAMQDGIELGRGNLRLAL